nr:MAG TPA: hypothetical protein [Caudoviricetes sp.]
MGVDIRFWGINITPNNLDGSGLKALCRESAPLRRLCRARKKRKKKPEAICNGLFD